ncbi:hypothetical protein HK099_001252 [Clydaea vesicula]|uniref:Uncharacterized protein n=1 Tax=Clydaea vesicula TaxID=447962 RepID=A0AAD5TUJ6_9FUNG|nr:hypothetical protein HK099_001252 [Clydaea vesicula]
MVKIKILIIFIAVFAFVGTVPDPDPKAIPYSIDKIESRSEKPGKLRVRSNFSKKKRSGSDSDGENCSGGGSCTNYNYYCQNPASGSSTYKYCYKQSLKNTVTCPSGYICDPSYVPSWNLPTCLEPCTSKEEGNFRCSDNLNDMQVAGYQICKKYNSKYYWFNSKYCNTGETCNAVTNLKTEPTCVGACTANSFRCHPTTLNYIQVCKVSKGVAEWVNDSYCVDSMKCDPDYLTCKTRPYCYETCTPGTFRCYPYTSSKTGTQYQTCQKNEIWPKYPSSQSCPSNSVCRPELISSTSKTPCGCTDGAYQCYENDTSKKK